MNAVSKLREHLGVSQRELGEPVGCHQSDVSNLERERRALSAEAALRWWDFYRPVWRRLGFNFEDIVRMGRKPKR